MLSAFSGGIQLVGGHFSISIGDEVARRKFARQAYEHPSEVLRASG